MFALLALPTVISRVWFVPPVNVKAAAEVHAVGVGHGRGGPCTVGLHQAFQQSAVKEVAQYQGYQRKGE